MSDLEYAEERELYDDPANAEDKRDDHYFPPDEDAPVEESVGGAATALVFHENLEAIDGLVKMSAVMLDAGPVHGGDLKAHAIWLVALRDIKHQINDVEQQLQDATASLMDRKDKVIDGVGVLSRHERKSRTQWDKEMLLRAVLDSRIVDKDTGEVRDEAPVDKVTNVWNLGAPRVTALKARGLDADEFCVVEKKAGWSVEVKGA
jgi:hypothetical protein